MESRHISGLGRKPNAMVRYKRTGKLPKIITPTSPLIELLETIPSQQRRHYRGIRMSPALGYQCTFHFQNADQMYRWLKPAPRMREAQSWPAEQRRLKAFREQLTLRDLVAHCETAPGC